MRLSVGVCISTLMAAVALVACASVTKREHPPWVGSPPEGTPVLVRLNCGTIPEFTTLESVTCIGEEVFTFTMSEDCYVLRPLCLRREELAAYDAIGKVLWVRFPDPKG